LPQITVTGYTEIPKTALSNSRAANPASVAVLDYSDEDKRNARTYGDIHNPFGYAQFDLKPLPWVKLTGGIRYDILFYDVADIVNRVNPSPVLGSDSLKAGLSVTPVSGLDFFANFGEGFRPPDRFGAIGTRWV
jgi:outer membrane receptor protein involved in Fe transport